MTNIVEMKAMTDLPQWLTVEMVRDVYRKVHCLPCRIANMKRLRQVDGSGVPVMVIGHTVSLDYQGPVSPSTMGSANGLFFVFFNVKVVESCCVRSW